MRTLNSTRGAANTEDLGRTPLQELAYSAGVTKPRGRRLELVLFRNVYWPDIDTVSSLEDSDVTSTVRILVEKGNADPMIGNALDPSAFHCWTGATETYCWLRNQDYVYVNIAEVSEEYGKPVYHSLVKKHGQGIHVALELLSQNKDVEEVSYVKDANGCTMLGLVIHSAYLSRLRTFWQPDWEVAAHFFEHTLRLGSKLVKHGSDIHYQMYGETLLSGHIMAFSPICESTLFLPPGA